MPASSTSAAQAVLREFDSAWRDGAPVFGCCRRTVETAVDGTDLADVAPRDVTVRVQSLSDAVERSLPGHLDTHRCCAGHVADIAFDLPDLIAPAEPHGDG